MPVPSQVSDKRVQQQLRRYWDKRARRQARANLVRVGPWSGASGWCGIARDDAS
jgi:hypothetical protein